MDVYRRHEEETLTAAQQAAQEAAAGVGSDSEDEGFEDGEGEFEDDLMDKISSSPSIEDGTYYIAQTALASWPRRVSSLPYSPRNRRRQLLRDQLASAAFTARTVATLPGAHPVMSWVGGTRSCSDPSPQRSHLLPSLCEYPDNIDMDSCKDDSIDESIEPSLDSPCNELVHDTNLGYNPATGAVCED